MISPKPMRDGDDDLSRLVAAGSAVRPMTTAHRARLWQRIERDTTQSRRSSAPISGRWLAFAFAGALGALALLLVVQFGHRPQRQTERPAARASTGSTVASTSDPLAKGPGAGSGPAPTADAPSTVHLGGRGELVLFPGASVLFPPGADAGGRGAIQVRLSRGHIAASIGPRAPDEPFTIVTPEVSVVVVGTRFSVNVEDGITEVAVEKGRVRVQTTAQAFVLVDAGESVRSDDPRLARPPLAVTERPSQAPRARAILRPAKIPAVQPGSSNQVPPPTPPCAEESEIGAYRTCLERAAQGAGLAAQNALLSLALFERDRAGAPTEALRRLHEYERRFPNGALVAEVTIAIANTLMAAGDREGACSSVESYLRRFPADRFIRVRLAGMCDAPGPP